MRPSILALAAAGLIAVLFWGPDILRAYRRRRLRRTPFPLAWERVLEEALPIYHRVPAVLRRQLRDRIQIFLSEKRFYGCGGLQITEDMKVIIAAGACLLVVNRGLECYPNLHSILVYPSVFIVGEERRDEAGVHTTVTSLRSGESWQVGRVILAWDEVEDGLAMRGVGHNTLLHEFAHQLDQEDGTANGVPILAGSLDYGAWSEVLRREYEALRERSAAGEHTVLDPYGAEAPAEFFAVATEAFFDKPAQLRETHPELYETLRAYYRVDPGMWS